MRQGVSIEANGRANKGNANMNSAQAMVGGDLFIHLLIILLKLRERFVSLCRFTSICVGALKFPLRRPISGREIESDFACSCGEVDVAEENGSFEV